MMRTHCVRHKRTTSTWKVNAHPVQVDYGLGNCCSSLELGCDCLGVIKYFDAVLSDKHGELHCHKAKKLRRWHQSARSCRIEHPTMMR